MLGTIQEYAHEILEALGEQAPVQERYLHFLTTLAQTAEPLLYEPERDAWLQRLDSEEVNLRAALAWCKDNCDAVERGLDLAGCLTLFWLLRGYLGEGLSWLEAMLTRTRETDRSYARAKVLYGAGFLSWKRANAGAGARYAEEALSIFCERGDRFWGSHGQWVLAVSRMAQGHLEQGRLLLEECLSGFKEVKSTWGEANALAFLGLSSEIQGNLAESLSYAQKSLELFQRIHDVVHSSVMLGILAATRTSLGDKEGARRDFEELHHTVGFSQWNRDAERRIKETGISYTILRANYSMQNLFGNTEQIKQGVFTNGPAANRIALIDARDIAAVAVAALTEEGHAGKTYDLNGPELLDGHAQAAVISRVLGRPVRYLDVSVDDFVGQLKSFGLPAWMVQAFAVAMADPEIPNQSSAEVERILHRKPCTLERFIKDYCAAFQA